MIELADYKKKMVLEGNWNLYDTKSLMGLHYEKIIKHKKNSLQFELTPKGKEIRDQLLKEVK